MRCVRFRALREQGISEEEIAARFFVPASVVKQRLRLAAVSPRLHDIYAADGMTLEQLMAFSVSAESSPSARTSTACSKAPPTMGMPAAMLCAFRPS